MRISREKLATAEAAVTLAAEMAEPQRCRKRGLASVIQAALKVGADYGAREAGRRAFAEFMRLDAGPLPRAAALPIADTRAMVFSQPKRRRIRAGLQSATAPAISA